MLKKIILFGLIFLMVITQTSCGSIPQNDMGEISNSENNNSANKKKDEEFTQRLEDRESLNIIYEDALGNKQNIKTEEINRSDKGTKLYDDIGCFVENNHFYYCQGIEIYRDKGEKLGEIRADVPNAENKYYDYWGKDGERLYVWIKEWLMEKFSFEMKQFVTVDLKSWKTKLTNSQKTYDGFFEIFVYKEKMYIQNFADACDKLDELDMNGKKVRTISFKTAKGKEDYVVLQGIMDGAIYYMTWNGNQHKLKSKDLVTGEEKTVMQYEQPSYNKKKWEYGGSYFQRSGDNLFIKEKFYDDVDEVRYTLYWLPLVNEGKMKCIGKSIVDCDFFDDNIYYIDNKHLLHRKNIAKGTDKIISKQKLEKVKCTKEGLFVNKYKEGEAFDEDGVESDVIYYMSFDGTQEEKIAEI